MKTAANTLTSHYLDTPDKSKPCAQDFKKIDKACKPESQRDEKNKRPALRKMVGAKRMQALDRMTAKVRGSSEQTDDNAWMSHCDGLWIKPDGKSFKEEMEEFNAQLKSMSEDLDGAIKAQLEPLVQQVGAETRDKALKDVGKMGAKASGRAAARWGAGTAGAAVAGVGAAVTETIATAWNIVDYASTGYEAYKLGSQAYGAIKEMRSVLGMAQQAQAELAELAASKKSATDLMANGMGVLSRLNPCTRARRCQLVPYNKTGTAESLGGKGCCPGQTGHHILPDEMTKDGQCEGYTKGSAPTICVEGATNTNGTHGMAHGALDKRVRDHLDDRLFGGSTLSYGKARDIGIRSVQQTFPESKCDEKCLRAQLDAYYKDKCKKPLPAVSGAAGAAREKKRTKK